MDLESKEGVLAALASPNLAVRYMAMAKLKDMDRRRRRGRRYSRALEQKENPWLQARAVWQSALIAKRLDRSVNSAIAVPKGRESDDRFQVLQMRILKEVFNQPPSLQRPRIDNAGSAAVRREALLLVRDVDPAKAKPLILDLAKQYDGKDRFYLEAIGIAVGHHDKARRDVILADFDKEFPEWNDKVADLVWELQPPSVMPSLGKRLADKSLTADQRGRIVDILAAADDKAAGASLLDRAGNRRAAGGPPEGDRQPQAVPAEQVARPARRQGAGRIDSTSAGPAGDAHHRP